MEPFTRPAEEDPHAWKRQAEAILRKARELTREMKRRLRIALLDNGSLSAKGPKAAHVDYNGK
jgi:hypothetical protein